MRKNRCIIVMLLLYSITAFADPAWPDSVLVHQPDGTDLWVYNRGDEFYNWVESTDGFVIVKNSKGVFEYATINGRQLVPSGMKVHNVLGKEKGEINYARTQVNQVFDALVSQNINVCQKESPLRTPNIPTSPVVGTRKVLTILAQFTDKPFTYAARCIYRHSKKEWHSD